MSGSRNSSPEPSESGADRRHSILSDFLPGSLQLPPSFLATSPIVREILTRDIDECSFEDEAEPATPDSGAELEAAAPEPKLAFHPHGVAYGCGYSMVTAQGLDKPVSNPREIEESLQAELDLLQDNDILPSKQLDQPPRNALVRVYRRLFSTKIKDRRGSLFSDTAVETTPLLTERSSEAPPTPQADEIYHCFEEAVASHAISTTWQREAKTLLQYATPLVFTFLMHYSVTIGSVLTVGRLGMVELAAVNCTSPRLPTCVCPTPTDGRILGADALSQWPP